MPVERKVLDYSFDELGERAKETARDWWRGCQEGTDWADFVIEDAATCAAILGIDLRTQPVKLMGGSIRHDPRIYWSGFCFQGGGSCFEGRWTDTPDAPARIREHAPEDVELRRIADALEGAQARNERALWADTTNTRGTNMRVDVDTDAENTSLSKDDYETVREALQDFATWIYRQLEREYEWQNADEQVDEAIRANEYTFDKEGRRSR